MGESLKYMGLALILAIVLVYMILAAQFDSFVQPITIMLSLPLSLVGAFGALYVSRMTLNIFSMIGIIMLMGLVTKNAILLVDFTNHLRDSGEEMYEALVKAGIIRLRPIFMTTAAMIFGMIPVALAMSEGGETRAPMAVCVIGGLITSTALTLVVVPVVYTFLDRIAHSGPMRWIAGKLLTDSPQSARGTRAGSRTGGQRFMTRRSELLGLVSLDDVADRGRRRGATHARNGACRRSSARRAPAAPTPRSRRWLCSNLSPAA